MPAPQGFDPKLDLLLERLVDVPTDKVWRAWTEPEQLTKWFCPKPWWVSDCTLELKPGGRFDTVMRSPEGVPHPNEGCILEVVPGKRLVWTDALCAGFRPSSKGYASKGTAFSLTAVIELEPEGKGTRYRAWAMHADADGMKKHAEMGFSEGWGAALDQLVELCVKG